MSILLAAEAMKRHPSFEATKAFKKGLQLLPQTLLHIQRTTSYTRLVASADGSHLVAAGEAGLVWIQHAYEDTCLHLFPELTYIHALALNADGTRAVLLYGSPLSHDAWIVDLLRRRPPQRLHHDDVVVQALCRRVGSVSGSMGRPDSLRL